MRKKVEFEIETDLEDENILSSICALFRKSKLEDMKIYHQVKKFEIYSHYPMKSGDGIPCTGGITNIKTSDWMDENETLDAFHNNCGHGDLNE